MPPLMSYIYATYDAVSMCANDRDSNIDKINIAGSTKPVAIYSLDVIIVTSSMC